MKKHTVVGKLTNIRLAYPDFLVSKNRTVRIWTPKEYRFNSHTPYDVIYALDGQNLFDSATSFIGREWEIDETIEAKKKEAGIRPAVVVGLDNSADRLSEYFPRLSSTAIGTLGYKAEITFAFLLNVVIPYVEEHYNVRKDKEGRSFLGSSMGGLMAIDAALKYNKIFGNIYAFSPSFTMYKYGMEEIPPVKEAVGNNSTVRKTVQSLCKPSVMNSIRLILESGGVGQYEHEGLKNVRYMYKAMLKNGWDESHLALFTYPEDEHNEDQWNEAFYDAYQWMHDIKKEKE